MNLRKPFASPLPGARAILVLAPLILVTFHSDEAAADCIEYQDSSPHLLGSVETSTAITDVAASGNYAYIVDGTLRIFDVSNPASPQIVGSLQIYFTTGARWKIALSGPYAYVVGTTGNFVVIDVSNPASPTQISNLFAPDKFGNATSITVTGNTAWVTDVYAGLYAVDVTNPASPVVVRTTDTPGQAYGVAVSGSYAYVADNPRVQVIQISPYAGIVHTVDTFGARKIVISGSFAYVADGGGLAVIDISNPLSAHIVGRMDTPDYAVDVAVSGFVAYIGDRSDVIVSSVADPTSPVPLNSVVANGSLEQSIDVSPSLLFVTDWRFTGPGTRSGTFLIYPSQCPHAPPAIINPGTRNGAELTFFSVGVTATDIEGASLTMSLAEPAPAWATFSDLGDGNALLSGTPQPGQAGTYPITIRASNGLASSTVDFNIVIAPAQKVVNLTSSGFDPGTVTIPSDGQVTWVKMANGNHTTTNGTGPLDPAAGTLWDAQLRSTSTEFTRVFPAAGTFPYFCRNHPSETGTITVSDAQTGVDETVSPRLRLAASPNPFRSGVDLAFDLEQAKHVSVIILDLQGRKVRELITDEFPAGTHRATWEGRDDNRAPVAPGLYFARLTTGDGHVQVQKLFKIR